MTSHYAPNKAVRLNVTTPKAGDIYIGFGACAQEAMFNLSPSGDLVEAAAQLFSILHKADQLVGAEIAIAPIPKHGIGLAIYDRLQRAAADRPGRSV